MMSADLLTPATPAIRYLGFWRRVLARLLDLAIGVLPGGLLYGIATHVSVLSDSILPFVVSSAISIGIVVFTTVKYGGSPGKLIMKARIVDANGFYLTPLWALLRCFFYLLYLIVLVLILQEALNLDIDVNIVNRYLTAKNDTFGDLRNIVLDLTLLDQLVIPFNRRKRSLHDLIAGSYVVSLSSVAVMRGETVSAVASEAVPMMKA